MSRFCVVLFLFTSGLTLGARYDQKAKTSDGKEVILRDNGTWQYVEKKEANSPSVVLPLTFRKTFWGMDHKQVKNTEGGSPEKDDENIVAYRDTVAGVDTLVVYYFTQDHLVRARYAFLSRHTNSNDYIDDFKKVKDAMEEKYGKPKADDVIWKKELYKDDPQNWGTAVSAGHLVYGASWDTPWTRIELQLFGDNFEVSLIAEYESKYYAGLEDESKKSKEKSKF